MAAVTTTAMRTSNAPGDPQPLKVSARISGTC
jgi:hypothetical protein